MQFTSKLKEHFHESIMTTEYGRREKGRQKRTKVRGELEEGHDEQARLLSRLATHKPQILHINDTNIKEQYAGAYRARLRGRCNR